MLLFVKEDKFCVEVQLRAVALGLRIVGKVGVRAVLIIGGFINNLMVPGAKRVGEIWGGGCHIVNAASEATATSSAMILVVSKTALATSGISCLGMKAKRTQLIAFR